MAELNGQLAMFDDGENYRGFVDKFKPAKTTDDCYTPENIYEAVAGWVAEEYGVDRESFVRPFWPGAAFEYCEYPEGCVVVDNPPFSILQRIVNFYMAHGIRFFLFAPALTLLRRRYDVCCIACGISIIYENGASVNTGFVTNLEPGTVLRTAPELYAIIDPINTANEKKGKAHPPKYEYPDQVVTSAICNRWSKYGVDFKVMAEDCRIITALDSMKQKDKTIFGYGLLLSERAAAERAAAVKWQLSEREWRIVREMGETEEGGF